MLAYGIAEFGCVGWVQTGEWYGVSTVAWSCIGLSVVCAAIALAAIVAAYKSLPANGHQDSANDPRYYTALLGLGLSSLFALAIVFESIPIVYYLQHC